MNEAQYIVLITLLILCCLFSLAALLCQLIGSSRQKRDTAWIDRALRDMADPDTLRCRRMPIERR